MFDKDLFLSLCDKYDVKFSENANEPIICENRNKLIQHIKMDMPGFPKQGLYCYGEASFEANQAMQEPLEKLYKYENQPDMREKVREYVSELDEEIDKLDKVLEDMITEPEKETVEQVQKDKIVYENIKSRVQTLMEVKNDLESRLEELI